MHLGIFNIRNLFPKLGIPLRDKFGIPECTQLPVGCPFELYGNVQCELQIESNIISLSRSYGSVATGHQYRSHLVLHNLIKNGGVPCKCGLVFATPLHAVKHLLDCPGKSLTLLQWLSEATWNRGTTVNELDHARYYKDGAQHNQLQSSDYESEASDASDDDANQVALPRLPPGRTRRGGKHKNSKKNKQRQSRLENSGVILPPSTHADIGANVPRQGPIIIGLDRFSSDGNQTFRSQYAAFFLQIALRHKCVTGLKAPFVHIPFLAASRLVSVSPGELSCAYLPEYLRDQGSLQLDYWVSLKVSETLITIFQNRAPHDRYLVAFRDSWTCCNVLLAEFCSIWQFHYDWRVEAAALGDMLKDLGKTWVDLERMDSSSSCKVLGKDGDFYWFRFWSTTIAEVFSGKVEDTLVEILFALNRRDQEWKDVLKQHSEERGTRTQKAGNNSMHSNKWAAYTERDKGYTARRDGEIRKRMAMRLA